VSQLAVSAEKRGRKEERKKKKEKRKKKKLDQILVRFNTKYY